MYIDISILIVFEKYLFAILRVFPSTKKLHGLETISGILRSTLINSCTALFASSVTNAMTDRFLRLNARVRLAGSL